MMQKKIRSLIYAGLGLVLCVLLCGEIGMTAQAAEKKTYNGFTYEENESDITITKYTGNKTKLVIPEEIDGKKVTSIRWYAFKGCSGLTSITIPAGVTDIWDWAFYGCSGLTSIKVSKENKCYDSRNNCNAIIETESNTLVLGCKKTVIPDSVTSIGDSAFSDCSGLKSITIPEGVTSIGNSAFSGCSGLKSITIPKKVTSIRGWAFGNCSGLTSITIPEGVTSIGGYAFSGCSSLTSIMIPKSVTSIGGSAFYGCSGLTSITIPASVTSIGNDLFFGCSDLTSIIVDKKINIMIAEIIVMQS